MAGLARLMLLRQLAAVDTLYSLGTVFGTTDAAAAPIDVDVNNGIESITSSVVRKSTANASKNEQDLLGLLNEIPSASSAANVAPSSLGGGNDLLGLLESNVAVGPSLFAQNNVAPTSSSIINGNDNSLDLFSSLNSSKPEQNTSVIFDQSGLKLEFTYSSSNENSLQTLCIRLDGTNSTQYPLDNFVFQAAVTKAFQIQMMPPSTTTVPPMNGGVLNQLMKIHRTAPNQALRMRIKINYTQNGQPVLHQTEVNTFPIQL